MRIRMFSFVAIAIVLGVKVNAVDISPYISGSYTDADGQTLLHLFAKNCGDKNFKISIKPFEFIENRLPAEAERWVKNAEYLDVLVQMSPDLAMGAVLTKVIEYVRKKDKDSKTAFDLMKENNSGNEKYADFTDLLDSFNDRGTEQDIKAED